MSPARRLVPAGIAVLLGTAFLTLVLAVGASVGSAFAALASGSVGDAAVVITPGSATITQATVDAARRVPGTSDVTARRLERVEATVAGRRASLTLENLPPRGVEVVSGRLPSAGPARELVAVEDGSGPLREIGTTVPVRAAFTDGPTHDARVVGVVRVERAQLTEPGTATALAGDAVLDAVAGRREYSEVRLGGTPSVEAVRALPAAAGLAVRTGADEKALREKEMGTVSKALTSVFSVFAVVALAVTGLVIANVFGIVVAQRTRELALLRCVGATRGQVRRSVLREALVVGLVGSVAGVGLGLLLARAGIVLTRGTALEVRHLVVTPLAVALPLLVGTVVTLVAAMSPARRATRVEPIAALRPLPPESRATSRRRVLVGTLLALAGAALLLLGANRHVVVPGVVGGLVCGAAVLVLGPVLVPACVGLLGVGLRRAGVPGELAVDNARRNPARTASTASALLVGITLMTMASVGSATAGATTTATLDAQAPVDLTAVASASLTAAQVDAMRTAPGVRDVALVAESSARVAGGSVVGLDLAHRSVVRDDAALDGLADDTVVLPRSAGVAAGTQVPVRLGSRAVTLRAVTPANAPGQPVVSLATLRRVDPAAKGTAWLRIADGADVTATTDAVVDAVPGAKGLVVVGPAASRAQMQQTADVVLYVVLGLLGVAVVIALVGIASTLGLGVLERTRELGLLRALGLTRAQTRRAVGLEALAVAAVATVLGLVLGTAFGIAGIASILPGGHLVVAMPWGLLAASAAVALLAGWLASVGPARRAASVDPSVALAAD